MGKRRYTVLLSNGEEVTQTCDGVDVLRSGALHFWNLVDSPEILSTVAMWAPGTWRYYTEIVD